MVGIIYTSFRLASKMHKNTSHPHPLLPPAFNFTIYASHTILFSQHELNNRCFGT